MYQTRIDKILEGKITKDMYPPTQFETSRIMYPLIKKFGEKDAEELKKEIIRIERRLKLICYDFPKIIERDVDFLRKFVLLLKIINRILKKSFNLIDFTFSWEEIISNLLHLEDDPNLMIKSMIRELKRKNSYRASILNRRERYYNTEVNSTQILKYRQKNILEFVLL